MRGLLGFFLLRLILLPWLLFPSHPVANAYDGARYDSSAYTQCQSQPEAPLYNGGIRKFENVKTQMAYQVKESKVFSPAYVLDDLSPTTRYSFSCWVKIQGAESAAVTARLSTNNYATCIGTTMAKNSCWSFLKGGFVLDSFSKSSMLSFQSSSGNIGEISVASVSLQPFSVDQWRMHQEGNIRTKRKRMVTIHVADTQGNRVAGASVSVQQLSKDFPIGSAIAGSILGNPPYQAWFLARFNAAVFENELKWDATEPVPGKPNYAVADALLAFVRANKVLVRGHNIFWENPQATPFWLRNLAGEDLRSAVKSRIQSLMSRYKGEFVHWDVNNEMLHFNFYEQQLGPNASLELFSTAQEADPLATLFMNEFNVIETCDDAKSTVDSYMSRLKDLSEGGAVLEGIGLQGHFGKPNYPLMRAILDKLATMGLPIWLTELDISNTFDHQTQASYLEEVLREGFSHPSVNGMMLWTALHGNQQCYQMCLTDGYLRNLPTGDVVDKLVLEWQTKEIGGATDELGSYSFSGFLGEYKLSASYANRSTETTFSLPRGDETRHVNIQL